MSRVAKMPVNLPNGVEAKIDGKKMTVKGSKGTLDFDIHDAVEVKLDEGVLSFEPKKNVANSIAMAGTTRALLANIVHGVNEGFERKLQLVGVGYRAQMQGQVLNLSLGFSHPVNYRPPEGVTIETPTQTEVVIKGIDKQKVGQAAAEIRAYRPPEPYKGKGVKYSDEVIIRKDVKKK